MCRCRYLYDNRAHGLAQLLRGCRGRSIYWQRGGSRPQPRTWHQPHAESIGHIRVSEAQHHTQGAVCSQQMVTRTRYIFKLQCNSMFQQVIIVHCVTYTKSFWSHPQWSKFPFFTSHWFKIIVKPFSKFGRIQNAHPWSGQHQHLERSPEQPRSGGATELASSELEIVNWKGECRKGQGAGGGVVLAGSIHAVASGHTEPPPTPDTSNSR